MGVEVIAPNRNSIIVDKNQRSTLRTAKYFEGVSNALSNLPDEATAVSDVSVVSSDTDIVALKDKINELLAALSTAGVMA